MKFSLLSAFAALALSVHAVSVQQAPLPFELMSAEPLGSAPTKPVPGQSPMLICDLDAPQLLEITYLKINPNPPKKGADLFIEGEGFLAETITEGAFVEVEVRYGFIRLVKETIDLCEQLGKADKSCPLDRGVIKFAKSVELPGEIPPVSISFLAILMSVAVY